MPSSSMTRRLRRLVLPAFLTALSACSRQPSTDVGGDTGPTVIEFNNESLAQADVFVRAAGSDARRIGTVQAGRKEELVVPRDLAIRGSVTVFARLLARSAVPSTGSIALSPGTRLNVRLPIDEKALFVLPAQS
jgi:hypothetical protein